MNDLHVTRPIITQGRSNDIRQSTDALSATPLIGWENAPCDCSGDADRPDGSTRKPSGAGPAHGTLDTKRTARTTRPRDDGAVLAETAYANHAYRCLLPVRVARPPRGNTAPTQASVGNTPTDRGRTTQSEHLSRYSEGGVHAQLRCWRSLRQVSAPTAHSSSHAATSTAALESTHVRITARSSDGTP
jgi:hypothetical protein